MPMITMRYVTPSPRPELRAEIAALASRLSAEHLGKDPGVTAVLVEQADPQGWFIAGERPTEKACRRSGSTSRSRPEPM